LGFVSLPIGASVVALARKPPAAHPLDRVS
jgi:hypothetical protein